MGDFDFLDGLTKQQILNIRTSYLAKVTGISGNTARVQPLHMHKAVNGKAEKAKENSAVIPRNIKYSTSTITYKTANDTTKSMTVLVPADLAIGDIVYVGVCDRDITYAKNGKIGEATNRHHNINDSVIIRVM